MTRRSWLKAAVGTAALVAMRARLGMAATADDWHSFELKMRHLEQESGGRLGVAILDTGTGARAGHRRAERFPMCSTFKLLAVGAVLARADAGKENLGRTVKFGPKDIVAYSPATEKRVGVGMTVNELCAATMTLSDNTAANLLLASLGGPAGATSFARGIGDEFTRLDRAEPELNEALPGDPRDTSTPEQMLTDLRTLVLGKTLSELSRGQLTEWLVQNTTGDQRLRAGFPKEWKVGDKTGSGERGTTNDLAIVWPPEHAPVLIAAYLTGATVGADERNHTIAEVGRAVFNQIWG